MEIRLGLVILFGLLLLAFGIAIGWMGAWARIRNKTERAVHDHLSLVSTILDALPQPALATDNESNIIAHNTLAANLMAELNWN
ncbi:MAG TPA: hypothetical protein VN843_12550, partial [Anaerolineales bacterium]|nr:hypothetical protein [Anaerolineales bacterium]